MAIEDEWALLRLAYAYADAIDRGDGERLARIFTEDGVVESPRGPIVGRAQLAALPADVQQRYRKTFHAVHNQLAEVDGDLAQAVTYCQASHVLHAPGGNHICYEMAIRYADNFVRIPSGWQFLRRKLHVDWSRLFQVTIGEQTLTMP
jgi:ketosteroid isomerase-like protein